MRDDRPISTLWRVAPAVGLVFLAPFIGEFLLGNISITGIAGIFLLASLYGCGALLIREVSRRAGRGWATMVVLGVAFAIFEEGLVTQFLFNSSYHGLDLQSAAYIPTLGIGARLTLNIIVLHAIWSTAVGIALVESLVPERRTEPWLGGLGLAVTALVFVVGTSLLAYAEYTEQEFLASAPQFIGAAAVVLVLIVVAFVPGRRPRPEVAGAVPGPWFVGAFALVASSALLFSVDLPGWYAVAAILALSVTACVIVVRWSRRESWRNAHRLALAGGALLTYVWIGFPMAPLDESAGTVDLIGNAVFALGAVVLLFFAIRKTNEAKGAA